MPDTRYQCKFIYCKVFFVLNGFAWITDSVGAEYVKNNVDRFLTILTCKAEREIPPEEDEGYVNAAFTELFNEVKTVETPIIVEQVVAEIEEIVHIVRFPRWQGTQAGECEVKKALRKTLFKYKLHADEELFEKFYSYIRQYY